MFACDAHAGIQPQATSTTTVAAESATSPVAETTVPSGGSAETPTSLASAGLITSAKASSSAPPVSSPTSSSGAGENSNPDLSRNGQVALGIVLPLSAIAVALLAWLCPKPWKKNEKGGKSEGQNELHDIM